MLLFTRPKKKYLPRQRGEGVVRRRKRCRSCAFDFFFRELVSHCHSSRFSAVVVRVVSAVVGSVFLFFSFFFFAQRRALGSEKMGKDGLSPKTAMTVSAIGAFRRGKRQCVYV